MGLRLLHTADWQLGKPFGSIPGDAGALLREARFEAVRTLARLARQHEVAAVLVAGDVFDANTVADATVHKALQAMAGFPGPWVLLPGNHDACLAECVWTRLERLGRPANLICATTPEPVALADGRIVVLPAPLTARTTLDDLTAWMDAAETPSSAFRIGLAHGSVSGRLPAAAEAGNPIAPDRAERARLDHLALGDWHGVLEVAPRTWYAGTPEPDRFPDNEPGHALLVELDQPGQPARVQRLAVAAYRWRRQRLDLTGEADPAAAVDRLLDGATDLERSLLSLELCGSVDLAGRLRLDQALDRWSARLCHIAVDDGALELAAGAGPNGIDGVVGVVAERLAGRAVAGDAEAALALRLLHGALPRLAP